MGNHDHRRVKDKYGQSPSSLFRDPTWDWDSPTGVAELCCTRPLMIEPTISSAPWNGRLSWENVTTHGGRGTFWSNPQLVSTMSKWFEISTTPLGTTGISFWNPRTSKKKTSHIAIQQIQSEISQNMPELPYANAVIGHNRSFGRWGFDVHRSTAPRSKSAPPSAQLWSPRGLLSALRPGRNIGDPEEILTSRIVITHLYVLEKATKNPSRLQTSNCMVFTPKVSKSRKWCMKFVSYLCVLSRQRCKPNSWLCKTHHFSQNQGLKNNNRFQNQFSLQDRLLPTWSPVRWQGKERAVATDDFPTHEVPPYAGKIEVPTVGSIQSVYTFIYTGLRWLRTFAWPWLTTTPRVRLISCGRF